MCSEPFGSIKAEEVLGQLKNYHSLRKRSASLIVFILMSILDNIIPVPTPKSNFYVPVVFLFFHTL
jgi:hypothetical protein